MTQVLILALALALGPAEAAAHEPAPTPAFFALSVMDLDASVEWYTRVLDLEATHLPGSPRAKIALLQGDRLVVELVHASDAFPLEERLPDVKRRHLVHGLFKAGFFVDDLDGAIERFQERGARFRGEVVTDRVLQARTILMLDNSDNVIQLFERRKEVTGSEHQVAAEAESR